MLAPEALTYVTGTGDILRLPEVQREITGDFIILPCDLVCELDGSALLEQWMVLQAGLGSAPSGLQRNAVTSGLGGEKSGRRGGLGVWSQTKTEGTSVKGEETDFIATVPIETPVVKLPNNSLLKNVAKVVFSAPTDTLQDITSENGGLPLRHSLLRKHGRIKMLTTHRNAHLYFFPYWVMEMIKQNEKFDSVSEDVIGWWAKAGWQEGLSDKLGLRDIFDPAPAQSDGLDGLDTSMTQSGLLEEGVDLVGMSTTRPSNPLVQSASTEGTAAAIGFASRVTHASNLDPKPLALPPLTLPPLLAYIHPPPRLQPVRAPMIRRVDTPALLLTVSLALARQPSQTENPSNAYSHLHKIHPQSTKAQRSTVTTADSLIDSNASIAEKAVVKESVIGSSCEIKTGARLTRCLLMDNVVVGENAQLTGCIVGRRAKVGARCDLRECRVQHGFEVEEGTEEKGADLAAFEGLEEGNEGADLDSEDYDDGDGGGQEEDSEELA